MRLFVGIDFEDRQKNNLTKMQRGFLPFLTEGKATPQENMHCTLLFLGETDAADIENICQKLYAVAKRHKPFMTSFWDSMHFSNGCAVIKLKAHKNFVALQQDIESQLQDYVSKPTLKYLPHTTLYREAKFNMPFREVKKSVPLLNLPFEVNSFTLFDSARGQNGMVYTPITFFKLEK